MTDTLEQQRHNLTHAIGECILAWARVEYSVALLFTDSMMVSPFESLPVFESVISFEARLSMVTASISNKESRLRSPEMGKIVSDWEALCGRIRKKYVARNAIAHCDLLEIRQGTSKSKLRLQPFPSISSFKPDKETIGLSELADRKKIFLQLSDEVSLLRDRVRESLAPLRAIHE